ncbi:hypothetical protein [Micropruina sp.]|uniref:hypothetical protein n=1 Tax=Micropruina sp. TaxID=2737536 RepID=UPI0039E4A69E
MNVATHLLLDVMDGAVDASHTMLSEATSAAGVYVGMARGCDDNHLHVVAEDLAGARAQFIEAMERDPADRGLDHATAQAIDAGLGLVADGPAQLVTDELTRLTAEAAHAERTAERWKQTATRFDAQRATYKAEDDEQAAVLRRAESERPASVPRSRNRSSYRQRQTAPPTSPPSSARPLQPSDSPP